MEIDTNFLDRPGLVAPTEVSDIVRMSARANHSEIQHENFFSGYHDVRLFYQTRMNSTPKAHLIITHGQGEHSGCYSRVFEALAELPLKIWAWDWRGHGRSDGLRGYAANFSDYIHDFEVFMRMVQAARSEDPTPLPLITLGHSMGGLIQLKSLISHPHWSVQAQILSSPMLGVSVQIPAIKQWGAKFLASAFPQVTLGNEIRDTDLSSDPAVLAEFKRDVLRHSRISSRVYLGSLNAIKFVQARANKLQIPTLIQAPEEDAVVSTKNCISFFEGMATRNKSMQLYPGLRHEIYNDLGRQKPLQDLKNFISTQIGKAE